MKTYNIGLCGFGGQGIILTAVVIGTTMVTRQDGYAVQTQSYGSEARGGQCQAELILSNEPINATSSEKKDLLIAMFQSALDKYLHTLKPEGILIIDPKMVKVPTGFENQTLQVPATEIAVNLGNRLTANMVILGYLQEKFKFFSKEALVEVVKESVAPKYMALNIQAIDAGIAYAKQES